MITGELAGEKTLIHMGSHVQVGYYSQEQEWLSPDRTVIDEVRDLFQLWRSGSKKCPGDVPLSGRRCFQKKISLLSGGEKGEAVLVMSLSEAAELSHP